MSDGLVICSQCKREVHQIAAGKDGWIHCEDLTPRCEGADSVYPKSLDEVVGRYCGMEEGLKKSYIRTIFTDKDYRDSLK